MKKLIIVIFILLTLFFLINKPKEEKEEAIKEHINNEAEEKIIKVKLKDEEKIITLDLEDYIVGVVACEMPASFEEEAIKAFSVAARTYAIKKLGSKKTYDLENSTNNQCYYNKTQMKSVWNKTYDKYYNKLVKIVYSTKGQYLTYKDKVILALYFSTSNGYTENVENVFSQKLAYLKSVSSPNEEATTNYKKSYLFTQKEFLKLLDVNNKELTNIEIIERSKTNRIINIKINDKVFKGTTFRTLLGLNSTDFTITKQNTNIKIETTGYGHGVGLSQYGSNEMAKLGYSYEEILFHYYTDVKLNNV